MVSVPLDTLLLMFLPILDRTIRQPTDNKATETMRTIQFFTLGFTSSSEEWNKYQFDSTPRKLFYIGSEAARKWNLCGDFICYPPPHQDGSGKKGKTRKMSRKQSQKEYPFRNKWHDSLSPLPCQMLFSQLLTLFGQLISIYLDIQCQQSEDACTILWIVVWIDEASFIWKFLQGILINLNSKSWLAIRSKHTISNLISIEQKTSIFLVAK